MKDEYRKLMQEFKAYAIKKGIQEENILTKSNYKEYVDVSADAYEGYPLHMEALGGKYDKKLFSEILSIDFKSRISKTIGLATNNFESIILIEPPKAKKTGVLDYISTIKLSNFHVLFAKPSIYLMKFEKYAAKHRKLYSDDKTWYLYNFTTKKDYQRKGYGKFLINIFVSFVKENNYRICFETNDTKNVPMYEHFGFKVVKEDKFGLDVYHYVLVLE